MKKINPFKGSPLRILVWSGLFLGLLWLVPVVMGVHRVLFNHSIARVRIEGQRPGVDEEEIRDALKTMQGFRRCQVALESLRATNRWRAEIEFEAESMTQATLRLMSWQKRLPLPVRVTAERLTYQTLRLERPGRGDIVFGVPQTLLQVDLNDSRDEPISSGN